MVKSFFGDKTWMGPAFAKVNNDEFYLTGRRVGGSEPYGKLYEWRALTLLDAIRKAGHEFR